jgi:protein ImuA
MLQTKKDIIQKLQKDILKWQGFTPPLSGVEHTIGLGPVETAFPNGIFPRGAIHEFLSTTPEHAAASGGFIGGLLQSLMQQSGVCLWISTSRTLFPPALKTFGVAPDRIIFIDLTTEKDVLWAVEEALKCEGLAAVIAEIKEVNFTQSRRMQLAVEQSKVTGFLLRTAPSSLKTTACVARWKITPLASETEEGLPGLGFPRWHVELLKVRHGAPGSWKMEWSAGTFKPIAGDLAEEASIPFQKQQIV